MEQDEFKKEVQEERKQRVQHLYEHLEAEINRLCEEADQELARELASIQRQEDERREEPA